MKILMIGLGSIGQRHLRNLRCLYGNDIEVSACRERGLSRTFTDQMDILPGAQVEETYHVISGTDLKKALSAKPDAVFVTNITSRHMECAIEAARAGCHIFLEKPISHTLKGVDTLKLEAEQNHADVFVGYQYRYHACLLKLKEYLDQGALGTILSVQAEMGECLDQMHSYENYRDSYIARKDMGGGVVLNQQIHELDYLQWLFGKPESVYAVCGFSSSYSLDVEDSCQAVYCVRREKGILPVSVHADFVQSPPTRRLRVIGDRARVDVDLLNNKLYICRYGEEEECLSFPDFERNTMFVRELEDFMEGICLKKKPSISLDEGIISLKMALGAKESGETGSKVLLNL